MMNTAPTASELIDLLGGTAEVARMLRIRAPSVTGWRSTGVPEARLIRMAVQLHAKGHRWNRYTLFPTDWHEIWPELIGAPDAPAVPGVASHAEVAHVG